MKDGKTDMLYMKLVSFDDTTAVVDCYPEWDDWCKFTMKLDVRQKKILSDTVGGLRPEYEEHAAEEIFMQYKKTGTLQPESFVVWDE